MRHAPVIFGAFVVILVAVIMAPTVIDFTSTDSDEHGRVPVPGQRVLELPEGRVGVWYGERRRMPGRPHGDTVVTDSLPVPALNVRAVRVDGGAEAELVTAFVDGTQIGSGGRTTRQFGVLEVPAEGGYRVSVRSRERIRYPEPVLSLGTDSSQRTEFAPSEWLLDHIQAVVLGGIALLLAVMILPRFVSGGGGPPPPPAAGGGGGRVHLRL